MVVRSEKLILVEALGRRTQIGKGPDAVIFSEREGYEYPVAEMDVSVAKPLIAGEQLTVETRDALTAKLEEVAAENAEIDKMNKHRPPNSSPVPRVKVPEEYHGHLVNFREAVLVGKPKKKAPGKDAVDETDSQEVPGLSDLKWNDLRKLAKEKGIDTLRKTREEIEAELQALTEE